MPRDTFDKTAKWLLWYVYQNMMWHIVNIFTNSNLLKPIIRKYLCWYKSSCARYIVYLFCATFGDFYAIMPCTPKHYQDVWLKRKWMMRLRKMYYAIKDKRIFDCSNDILNEFIGFICYLGGTDLSYKIPQSDVNIIAYRCPNLIWLPQRKPIPIMY